MTKSSTLKFLLFIFLGLLILVDRAAWASVSQWHNDQSINLWIGYTQNISTMPVGLMSTYHIPNPNGMMVIGYLLSRLPNLWMVSAFLGCSQTGLILWITKINFKSTPKLMWLSSLPLLSSVILRITSVEFWNQYFMSFVNLLFLLWAVSYLAKPSVLKVPLLVVLICCAPAIYLAGIVNAITMLLLGAAICCYRLPADMKKTSWMALALSQAIICTSIGITWLPYFRAVGFSQILNASQTQHLPGGQLAFTVFLSIVLFPLYAAFQWAVVTFLSGSLELYNKPAQLLIPITIWLGVAQGILALTSIGMGLKSNLRGILKNRTAGINRDAARLVILSAAFILLSYTLSPLLGGPAWVESERFDQTIQFLPLFMLVCFPAPFIFPLPYPLKNLIPKISYTLAVAYVLVNLTAGFFMVQSLLDYRGSFLSWSNMDVPLIQKMQAVDFMAADWEKTSNQTSIPVDYRLEGGIWSYISTIGSQYNDWYPAPMTYGRSLDFDLLRRYGLTNTQEGVQPRVFGNGRYLVTYAFEPEPEVPGATLSHVYFGRIRVSVVSHP